MQTNSRVPYIPFSILPLLLVNIATIVFAVDHQWSLSTILWIYWTQSVIIGIFQFRKILDLKQFSTKGFRINGRAVEPTEYTKKYTAWFFVFHYGIFHVVYAIFLGGLAQSALLNAVLVAGGGFLAHHLFSYFSNRSTDELRKPNIGTMMFFPYARVAPMHFFILFLSQSNLESAATLVAFLGLKTAADVIMHVVEHNVFFEQKKALCI